MWLSARVRSSTCRSAQRVCRARVSPLVRRRRALAYAVEEWEWVSRAEQVGTCTYRTATGCWLTATGSSRAHAVDALFGDLLRLRAPDEPSRSTFERLCTLLSSVTFIDKSKFEVIT